METRTTKCTSRGHDMQQQAVVTYRSSVIEGVEVTMKRLTFQSRLELLKDLRPLLQKLEFLSADPKTSGGIERAILEKEVETELLKWGVVRIYNTNDGSEVMNTEKLLDTAPVELADELVGFII